MPEPLTETVISKLSVHLGPHVARMTVKSFAKKVGAQEQLTADHLPRLIEEIRPMLNVMIGKGASDSVVADIERATTAR